MDALTLALGGGDGNDDDDAAEETDNDTLGEMDALTMVLGVTDAVAETVDDSLA